MNNSNEKITDTTKDGTSKESYSDDKLKLQKLTPKNDIDMKVYTGVMNYIFRNNDIKNIAVSGPYSSGKSSVIETYKKENTKEKFLHISLAHFNKANGSTISKMNFEDNRGQKEDDKRENNEDRENETRLEGKIINQLIQQIDPSKISLTNFHVKRAINKRYCLVVSSLIFLVFIDLCFFVFISQWKKFVNEINYKVIKNILFYTTSNEFMLFVMIIFGVITFLMIYQLIKEQKSKMIFRKFNLQGNEIELFSEDEDSYFDKYLNEVLYLFENSGMDAIVFEDIDRFDDVLIFERLHEINRLANLRLERDILNKRTLRFFYLIRDDVFASKDRIKFFDFILPIIPVIDGSNSYDMLKKIFDEGKISERFDDKFLRGLSLYIDDMRILKNIYNEFAVYFYKLQEMHLNCDVLLALITYKNIFPKDFSDLQLKQGYVFECFKKKMDLNEERTKEYTVNLLKAKERKEYYQKEVLKSFKELDWVKESMLQECDTGPWAERSEKKEAYNKWEEEEYPKRKKAIEDLLENRLPQLENDILIAENDLFKVKNSSLSELIIKGDVNAFFQDIKYVNDIGQVYYFEEIKTSEYFDLLKYLISNGYINETYSDYMSYYYDDSLKCKDKIFVRSVAGKEPLDYNYEIDNFDLIMQYLRIEDFAEKQTMNFDLFMNLLETDKYTKQLELFIIQLRENKYFDFISDFYREKNCYEKLIGALNFYWVEFLYELISNKKWEGELIKKFCVHTLYYSDSKKLDDINKDGCLTEYISKDNGFLDFDIDEKYLLKFEESLKKLNVKFVKISTARFNDKLFDYLYTHSLYEINIQNIVFLLRSKYKIQKKNGYVAFCISLVFSKPDEPLYKYVERNINEFMNVLLNFPNCFGDNEDVILKIINKNEINVENKMKYLDKIYNKITNINDIKEDLYKQKLVEIKKIDYTLHNIILYYQTLGGKTEARISEELIEFINADIDELDYVSKDVEHDKMIQFRDACIVCNELNDKKYREIISCINDPISIFNFKGISQDKIMILIKEHIICMTNDNLKFLRKYYTNNFIEFIFSNIEEYIKLVIESDEEVTELLQIMKSDISTKRRMKVMKEIRGNLSVQAQGYDDILSRILENNFSEPDFIYLCNVYDKISANVRERLDELCKKHIAVVIDNIKSVDENLLLRLLNDPKISREERIRLFSELPFRLEINELIQWLETLDCPEIVDIYVTKNQSKFVIKEENYIIRDALRDKGYMVVSE